MGDYISREAAIAVAEDSQKKVCPRGLWGGTFALDKEQYDLWQNLIERLEAIPAADVEPVVPCKGCEHAERYERTDGTAGYYCGHPQSTFVYGERWDRVFKPVKKPDDFCSFGEPRGAKK